MKGDPQIRHLSLKEEKDFRIRFDVIVRNDIWVTPNWRNHPVVLKMVSYLPHRQIEELFLEVIKNAPFVDKDMKEYEDWLLKAKTSNDFDTRNENRTKIRNFLFENWGAGAGDNPYNLYYIYSHRYFGVNLNQPIEIKPHSPLFSDLFSFRLSLTKFPDEFLQYHFAETFKGVGSQFKLFLTLLDKEILSTRNEFIKEWVEQNLTRKQKRTKKKKTSLQIENKERVIEVLKDFCKRGSGNGNIVKAGKTLIEAIKNVYQENTSGAKIGRFFYDNKVISGIKKVSAEEMFKPSDLNKTEANSNLFNQLINLI